MAHKVEFVLLEHFENAHKKYGFELKGNVPEVVKKAKPGETLAIQISVNSPIKIKKAVNISTNPEKLFEVGAP